MQVPVRPPHGVQLNCVECINKAPAKVPETASAG